MYMHVENQDIVLQYNTVYQSCVSHEAVSETFKHCNEDMALQQHKHARKVLSRSCDREALRLDTVQQVCQIAGHNAVALAATGIPV